MKTITKILCTLYIVTLSLFLASCQNSDLEFDHETAQFDLRDNAILIELIAPTGTAIDDELYIFGAFNGLDENTAPEQLKYKLEKAQFSDLKWGIYLYPNNFVGGKTLADGFSFVSKKAGAERDINGQPVVHTLNAETGTRHNIWADRWASYFSTGDEKIQHNGYVVYVLDESGFADLHLYMYGDVNDLNGGWPGMKPTGVETLNGTEYTYFDMGKENNGLSETLIFNDNGESQLADYGPVVFDDNIYLHILSDGTIEKIASSSTQEHDGAVVYVLDGIGWGMNTTLYMWGDVNDLNGGWPGMKVGGSATFGDYTYLYFDMGKSNAGLSEHLIFSNGGASQLPDFEGYSLDKDIYLYIAAGAVTEIADPAAPGDVEWFNPSSEPKPDALIDLYFYNATDTLAPLHVYAWGSGEAFGGWPGQAFEKMDTVTILGLELLHTTVSGKVDDGWSLIFNDGADLKLPDYGISATDSICSYYLKIADSGVTPLQVAAQVQQR